MTELGPAERVALLDAARDAIEASTRRRPPQPSPLEQRAPLSEDGAAFVTLRSPDGALRGCIGELVARRPLIASVRDCAVGAAQRDPRFAPVSTDEVAALSIGISVLTPARPIAASAVVVGRHGLIVERGPHRGVLLPEVATERAWDRETFLRATCQKAGLPVDAWRDPETRLSAFESIKVE